MIRSSLGLVLCCAVLSAGLGGCGAQQYNERGLVSFRAQNYPSALAAFRQAAEMDPRNENYHYNVGAAYQALGDLNDAIFNYKLAIDIYPGLIKAHENMAICYIVQGQEAMAIQTLRRACEVNPQSAQPYDDLAIYFDQHGDAAKAEENYRKAVAADPKDWQGQSLLGEFLVKRGKREEGLKYYQESLRLKSANPEQAKRPNVLAPTVTQSTPATSETPKKMESPR